MPAAARVSDDHACPRGAGPVLHAGCSTVLIGNMPAARQGDRLACGSGTDSIATGEPSVQIGGAHAARMGDPTVGGGKVVGGERSVCIGANHVKPCMLKAAREARALVKV